MKLTSVGRLLHGDHPSEPLSLPITRADCLDPTFIPRLSFRNSPRLLMNLQQQIDHIRKLTDHAVFIDTSMTGAPTDWWEALLEIPGRVRVVGRVMRELVPHFQRNPNHPLRTALLDRHPAIVLVPDSEDDAWKRCFDYYRALLTHRRFYLDAKIRHFETQNGRPPSPLEREQIKMELQRFSGERTLKLNLKPLSPDMTDEALVFQAVHHAITTGQRTKIFSADSDVEEQFYALIKLLTAHYFGMLLGRLYAADFTRFRPRALEPLVVAQYDKLFEAYGATTMSLGSNGIHDFIPKHTTFVPVSSVTMGKEYVSELTYGFETTMAQVFATKAATLGLSTDALAGRDVHPWLVPEDFQANGSHDALIAFDTTVELPSSGMRISQLDIALTTWPGDPHAHVVMPDAPPSRRALLAS